VNFEEIAERVWLLNHPAYDVNCTLIVGDERAMLVDTLWGADDGLASAAARVTALPLVLVNTHFHFDHCLGNAALAAQEIWGHVACARELGERGEHWRLAWEREYELDLSAVTIRPPDHLVEHAATLDLGGCEVVLSHHGRGHTDGDLVARTGQVLVAGDLVEQGGPPNFEDSYPLDWPDTLAELMRLADPETLIVPGHGTPVDIRFLRAQHDELTRLDWLIRDGHADDAPIERVADKSPWHRFGPSGTTQSRLAVKRGYAQLAGRLEA
jgi:glyoxylase-like metal-dependent hydrolase (beta-lactamase superfamily II)